MAEWAQHWETVNGPVITAVYTGFCFSNLDIHKSLFLAPQLYWRLRCIKWCALLWGGGAVTTLIVRWSERLALWKYSELHLLLFLAVTLPERKLLHSLHTWRVRECSVSLAESKSPAWSSRIERWKQVHGHSNHISNTRPSSLTRCANSWLLPFGHVFLRFMYNETYLHKTCMTTIPNSAVRVTLSYTD